MHAARKEHGFSVVELVVVLIVIGILISIVGVNYASTQKSARSAQYKSDAIAIAKRAELASGYANGAFPLAESDFTGPASLESDNNLSIGSVLSSSTAAPTTKSQLATPPAYTLHVCTNTRQGVRVYYPDPETSDTAIGSIQAGKWSAGC